MRILVTGGAGFIGSQVAERLLADGHEVAVLDNLSTGHREFIPTGGTFFEADLRDRDATTAAFVEFEPEAICHQAAHASVGRSVREPDYDADVNIAGTLRLIMLCRDQRVGRIVFASSGGALYGEADRPVSEEAPAAPKSPYGISKAAGEMYLRFFAESLGGTAVALRYSNVYGPRQDSSGEGGVVSIFSERMLRGEPCEIFGDGEQVRDFVFVADVVEANVAALTASPRSPFEAINIGTGVRTTVNELAEEIARGVQAVRNERGDARPVRRPTRGPERPGDLRSNAVDPTKARDVLGWEPRASMGESLQATIAWLAARSATPVPTSD